MTEDTDDLWPPIGFDIDSDGHWSPRSGPLPESPSSHNTGAPSSSELCSLEPPAQEIEVDDERLRRAKRLYLLADRIRHVQCLLNSEGGVAQVWRSIADFVETCLLDDRWKSVIGLDILLLDAACAQQDCGRRLSQEKPPMDLDDVKTPRSRSQSPRHDAS